jgi:tetratricopeptide (TPR) repeat protein
LLKNRLKHKRKGNRHKGIPLCLVLLLFLFYGCAGNTARYRTMPDHGLPAQQILPDIPFYPQNDYRCGPAALAMTLAWSGLDITPDELTPEVYTPSQKGSTQPAMMSAARRHGRIAYIISSPEELIREIAYGHPVIVLQNLGLSWYPVWHYAVVIGYDLEAGSMLLHSGEESAKQVSLKVFNHTWSRSDFWGLMTLPPKQIPVSATESAYVEAVLGLEKAQQWQAAIEGYHTALERWPDSLPAGIGLGNAYYAVGDLSSAERAFREATRNSSESGAAFNNLAQVLWEQGKLSEALEAARTAVHLGGAMIHVYQKTLEDIKSDVDKH